MERNDEEAIRELVDTWMAASKAGDLTTLLGLMAEDVVFMVVGQEPFGKKVFAENFAKMKGVRLDPRSDIKEIKVIGDWAWMRNHLAVTFTPPGNQPTTHSGYVLTILNKTPGGKWVIARDANLLAPQH